MRIMQKHRKDVGTWSRRRVTKWTRLEAHGFSLWELPAFPLHSVFKRYSQELGFLPQLALGMCCWGWIKAIFTTSPEHGSSLVTPTYSSCAFLFEDNSSLGENIIQIAVTLHWSFCSWLCSPLYTTSLVMPLNYLKFKDSETGSKFMSPNYSHLPRKDWKFWHSPKQEVSSLPITRRKVGMTKKFKLTIHCHALALFKQGYEVPSDISRGPENSQNHRQSVHLGTSVPKMGKRIVS